MKLSMLALPILASGLVLAGCSSHRDRSDSMYDQPQTQSTTPPPPPASVPDNNSNTPGSQYPTTGGSR